MLEPTPAHDRALTRFLARTSLPAQTWISRTTVGHGKTLGSHAWDDFLRANASASRNFGRLCSCWLFSLNVCGWWTVAFAGRQMLVKCSAFAPGWRNGMVDRLRGFPRAHRRQPVLIGTNWGTPPTVR